MTKIEKVLKNIGLKESEAKTYLFLMRKSPASIADICRGVSFHRPVAYRALEKLQNMGLVCLSPFKNKKLYAAQDPKNLRELVEEKNRGLSEIMPELIGLYQSDKPKTDVKHLVGKQGIAWVFSDIVNSLSRGETFFRYTSEKDLDKVNSYLPTSYRTMRDAKKLERLVISNPISGKQKRPRLERFIKFIAEDENLFQQNIIELIYGEKIAFIDLNSETTTVITNKNLADFQKVIFKSLYKKL
ncbi:MAG: helix-turn-helix domain-containing protein [Candidatus Paceibacterota bacterium]|jgi:sugar-specific transcriptional regulator TrmB